MPVQIGRLRYFSLRIQENKSQTKGPASLASFFLEGNKYEQY